MKQFPGNILIVLFIILGTVSGCGQDKTTSPVVADSPPTIDTSGMLPAVAKQLIEAQKKVNEDPSSAATNGRLGMLLTVYEKDSAAQAYLLRAGKLDPQDPRWPYYFGVIMDRNGKTEDAVNAYRGALANEPENIDIQTALAKALVNHGDSDTAEKLLRAIIAVEPNRSDARFYLGKLLYDSDRHIDAIELLDQLVKQYGNMGPVNFVLSNAYRQNGDSDQANRHLALSQEFSETFIPQRDDYLWDLQQLALTVQRYLDQAAHALERGDFKVAEASFRSAIELNPESEAAYSNLLGLYVKLQQTTQATDTYQKVMALNPDLASAHFNYATLLFQQRKFDQAITVLNKALASDPGLTDARVRLGYAQILTGDTKSGRRALGEALQSEPEHRLANYLLGRELAGSGDYITAIAHLEKATAIADQRTPVYLQELANAYGNSGDTDKATALLDRARLLAIKYNNGAVVSLIDGDLKRWANKATDKPQ